MDESGAALARLGVHDAAQYLLRPDGYIAFRCAGTNFAGAETFLAEWLRAQGESCTVAAQRRGAP